MKSLRRVTLAYWVLAMVALCFVPNPAKATTYTFSGGPMINLLPVPFGSTPSFVPSGSNFTGMFTYDPNATLLQAVPTGNAYSDPTGSITFVDGLITYKFTDLLIEVFNTFPTNTTPPLSFVSIDSTTSVLDSPPFTLMELLFSYPGRMTMPYPIPTSINLADLFSAEVALETIDSRTGAPNALEDGLFTSLTLTTSTAVPEPTTMLLLGSGLIGLAGYGRKEFFKR